MNKKAFILLWAFLAVMTWSCGKEEQSAPPTRSEYIKVYETSENKTVDDIQVPFDGVQNGQIHILSNVDLNWKYMVDQTLDPARWDPEWFQIKRVEEAEPGHLVITYDAKSILVLNSLERREGKLSLSCPEASLGKFLSVRQGYQRQFLETFDAETDGHVTLSGSQTFTTQEYPVLNRDYFDYISFNAWAETTNEFRSKNITLDITVSGGLFYETGLTTHRVNVPIATQAEKDNLKYLLLVGNGQRMSNKTHFIFSVANDELVYVHIDNFAAYKVTEAELGYLFQDEDFEDEDEPDWE